MEVSPRGIVPPDGFRGKGARSAHAEPARFVNIVHQLHVSKTFFTIAAWLLSFEDAMREMIGFGDEAKGPWQGWAHQSAPLRVFEL